MNKNKLTTEQVKKIKQFQRNEITEYHIYSRLSAKISNRKNAEPCSASEKMSEDITIFGNLIVVPR